MIQIFETKDAYNIYTNNGTELDSGTIYYVEEDDSAHFITNNIDGVTTIYDKGDIPSGNVEITENGENINVKSYATATVNVPQPSGKTTITQNGTDIDIAQYASADVNVPIPPEYIIPTGNISITANANDIDVAQYATASVNVPSGIDDLKDLIERDITSITIPNGTTTIGQSVFNSCTSLTSVTIPNTVTTIGQSAFNSCTNLTSITIPSGVTTINQNGFANCTSLTNITIPDSVTTIGVNGFANCTSLTSITIGNGVRTINAEVFKNCTSLKRVNSNVDGECIIPNSVTTIVNGNYNGGAFGGCTSLTSVTIPNSVTSIGSWAFYGCSNLASITIERTTPPTLSANVFTSTNPNLVIYVPAESVDTYKAASGWSSYASRIQAIPTP